MSNTHIKLHQKPTHRVYFVHDGRKMATECYSRVHVTQTLDALPKMVANGSAVSITSVYDIEAKKHFAVEHFTNAEVSTVVAHHSDDIKLTDWFSFLDSSGNPIPELHQIDLIDILREYASSRGYTLAEDVTLR